MRVQTCAANREKDAAAAGAATAPVVGNDGADAEGGQRPGQSANAATPTDATAAAAAGGTDNDVTATGGEGWWNGGGMAEAAAHKEPTAQNDSDRHGDNDGGTLHADTTTGSAGAAAHGRGGGASASGTDTNAHEEGTHTCDGDQRGDAATAATTRAGDVHSDGDGARERTTAQCGPAAATPGAGPEPGADTMGATGRWRQSGGVTGVAAALVHSKRRRASADDAQPTRDDGASAAVWRRTRRDDGASTSVARRDEPGQDGELEEVAALPVRCGEEGERQQRGSASAARRRARGGSGSAARRGGSARRGCDGELEEVAAAAAATARKRPGADSDEHVRDEHHDARDGDARRATRQRGGDDSAAAAEAAAEERAGERRSNRQRAGLAAAPRDSDPCELASKLETQDAQAKIPQMVQLR